MDCGVVNITASTNQQTVVMANIFVRVVLDCLSCWWIEALKPQSAIVAESANRPSRHAFSRWIFKKPSPGLHRLIVVAVYVCPDWCWILPYLKECSIYQPPHCGNTRNCNRAWWQRPHFRWVRSICAVEIESYFSVSTSYCCAKSSVTSVRLLALRCCCKKQL